MAQLSGSDQILSLLEESLYCKELFYDDSLIFVSDIAIISGFSCQIPTTENPLNWYTYISIITA